MQENNDLNDNIISCKFSKEDFITEKPYEMLFKLRNERFKYQQMVTALNENADDVGFKRFSSMMKGYVESQACKGVIIENSTQFDGQKLELKTGPWIADDYGISLKNEKNGEDIACVHPIMPVERLVNIDTNEAKIKIAFRKGSDWRDEIYDKKTVAGASNILDLANNDISVTSENAKYLVRYLHDVENLNLDIIPQRNSVSRLGWTNCGDFSPYVDDLIFDGKNNFKFIFNSVKNEGNFDDWLQVAREVRATNSPARIVLAASFASVLLKLLGKPNFMVHLWGGTEVGKTVCLMLAASVWANPSEEGYIQTFNGTQVGIELLEGFMNSMPLILDEFQLVKEKKMFENTVYMICEGVGRIRGKKTGGLQDTPYWKNCTLTSGESPITNNSSGGGAVNRILEIECKDKLFEDAPGVADAVRKNYGHAGRAFISLLNNESAKKEVERLYKEFYTTLSTDSTEKQTMAAAIILTADELATRWIFVDNNALTTKDIEPYLHTKESVDVCFRGYNYLMDMIAVNRSKFINPEKDCTPQEVWGSITKEGKINIIGSIYEKICGENGYDATALSSWMYQKGYTEVTKDGKKRHRKKVKINGNVVSCICLINKEQDKPEDNSEFMSITNLTKEEQEDLPFT